MRSYTPQDCDQIGYGIFLKDKVVVLPRSVLPEDHLGQLFFASAATEQIPTLSGDSCFWFLWPLENSAGSDVAMWLGRSSRNYCPMMLGCSFHRFAHLTQTTFPIMSRCTPAIAFWRMDGMHQAFGCVARRKSGIM